MAHKKQQGQAKPGVKFQDQPASIQQVENKPQVIYKNVTEQRDQELKQFNKVQTLFKTYTASDPQCVRKDTAQSLKSLLALLRDFMQVLNIGTFEDKNSFYYLIYNGKIYIFDICRVLRKVNKFSRQDYNSYEKLIQQARQIFKKIIHQIYIGTSQTNFNQQEFRITFKPKLLDMIVIDQAKKKITSMSIFGKISANAVNVSLTCNDLNNTGIGQKIGAIVTINGLKRNQKYYFAVAAYDGTEGVSNGIGETGDEITTIHPLPLPLLASYLFKVAYQLSNFDICEEAADFCIMQFTENSEFIDRQLHNELNPIHVKRLLQQRIKSVSLMYIQNLTETLLIKAKCLQKKITNIGTQAQKHIVLLQICNYLLHSLETSLSCRHFTVAKRIVAELYNMLESFQQEKPLQLFQLLLKAQIIIVEIPKQYWDANLCILSAKFTYKIIKVCMNLNEITLGRRVSTAELQSFNRKWYYVPKIIMIEQVEDAKKDTKKDVKKEGKPQQVDELVQPPKQVPKLIRELYQVNSTVQDYLEETLLV